MPIFKRKLRVLDNKHDSQLYLITLEVYNWLKQERMADRMKIISDTVKIIYLYVFIYKI